MKTQTQDHDVIKIQRCSCLTFADGCSSSKIYTLLFSIATLVVVYLLASPGSENGILRLLTSKTSFPSTIIFNVTVDINNVIARVDEKFVSVCLTWRRRDVWKFNATREKRFKALTRALSPAYVRIGGTPSDFVVFRSSKKPYGTLTVHIDEEDLDRISEIAQNAGFEVLFTLSLCSRFKNGSWDPRNPYEIVKFVANSGYKFGWELGNESNHLKKYNVTVTPTRISEDFKRLKQHLLARFPNGTEPILVGPDFTQLQGKTLKYLRRFLLSGHSSIDAITWHHYYVRSQDTSLPEFYDAKVLDTLIQEIKDGDVLINKISPNLPKWLGETSSASGGGAEGISDRFVAGFMWLDKLGVAAKYGYEVVLRQALFYGHYSLIGEDLEPNPDYWLSLLHKKLFGTEVLEVKIQGDQHAYEMVRAYAHCSNTRLHKQGAVSLIAMNLYAENEAQVKLDKDLQGLDVDEYLFTPDGNITSRKMKLNNNLLEIGPDVSFPVLEPRRVRSGDRLILPPLTFAFYVIPDARARACLGRHKESVTYL